MTQIKRMTAREVAGVLAKDPRRRPDNPAASPPDGDVCWVEGTQGNHLQWVLPANLAHLNAPPLYMAVAWWGLLRGSPFTRADVSGAFRIAPRRAADVMKYICTARTDSIRCESWVKKGEMYLSVAEVSDPSPDKTGNGARKKKHCASSTPGKDKHTTSAGLPKQEGESLLQLWHRLTVSTRGKET